MVKDGPPLLGGGDGGYERVNGWHGVGKVDPNSAAIACAVNCGAGFVCTLASSTGVAQTLGAGAGWRWQGGRSLEDCSQGVVAQRATHSALASKESRSNATAGTLRKRIPIV